MNGYTLLLLWSFLNYVDGGIKNHIYMSNVVPNIHNKIVKRITV